MQFLVDLSNPRLLKSEIELRSSHDPDIEVQTYNHKDLIPENLSVDVTNKAVVIEGRYDELTDRFMTIEYIPTLLTGRTNFVLYSCFERWGSEYCILDDWQRLSTYTGSTNTIHTWDDLTDQDGIIQTHYVEEQQVEIVKHPYCLTLEPTWSVARYLTEACLSIKYQDRQTPFAPRELYPNSWILPRQTDRWRLLITSRGDTAQLKIRMDGFRGTEASLRDRR